MMLVGLFFIIKIRQNEENRKTLNTGLYIFESTINNYLYGNRISKKQNFRNS